MEIKHQIDKILSQRKKRAAELTKKREDVKALNDALKKVRVLGSGMNRIKDSAIRKEFYQTYKGLGIEALMANVDDVMKTYDNVIKRFSKDYLSIATIGKERQGKSRFLQSVSGLPNEVIPAYDGPSCTGATSIIRNMPELKLGELRAVISYRKSQEMVDLVREYVRTIDPSYPYNEIEFDDIEYLSLSDLNEKVEGDADKSTAYNHLSNIVNHFFEFRDYFDREPETLTDPKAIQKIVAQNNGLSFDNPNSEQYFVFHAVAKVEIQCGFYLDAGRIRIIDTIGIGATSFGVEQAMLDTVKDESDAAIVVTRPISAPQNIDKTLFKCIHDAFADKAPEKWLFYLVNNRVGENDNTVVAFDNGISDWAIADHKIIDCSDKNAVNDVFMKSLLEKLLANLGDIDALYEKELVEKITALNALLQQTKANIDGLSETTGVSGRNALEKGKECFNAMGAQLRTIVNHYYHEVNEPNHILWNETQKILNNLDVDINPGAEVIQNVADNNNVVGDDVWNVALHYVRNEITRRFSLIDDKLEKENIRFKNSLVQVLYDNLSELFADDNTSSDIKKDEEDKTAKLRTMFERILGNNGKYVQIYEAILFLDNFQFNTRATIIQTVRSQLGIINPLCRDYAKPEINFYAGECGREIDYCLTSRLSLIEENLRHELMGLYNTPNKAFYAVAEEFYDRLTFAATDLSSGKITNMSDVWGYFFQDFSSVIWKEQAQDVKLLNDLIHELKALEPLLQSCGV